MARLLLLKLVAATETEIEEKKFRVDDAVAAVKAALNEGIVPGGGVTLVDAVAESSQVATLGSQILHRALEQPFRILLENADLNADQWLPQIRAGKERGLGIDVSVAQPNKLVKMKEEGIVDPVSVTREAVQNAVSIAGTAMTMGALIVEIPKDTPAAPDMGRRHARYGYVGKYRFLDFFQISIS